VKEVFETVEIFSQASRHIREWNRLHKISCLYDLACGHGLLGVLLAYQFSHIKVVCVDRKKRECFESFHSVFKKHGDKMPHEESVLQNLHFEEGDATTYQMEPGGVAIIVHGCNGVSPECMKNASQSKCGWIVCPCCIPEELYLPGCKTKHLAQDQRYSFNCGLLAMSHDAETITSFNRRITNKNVIMMKRPPVPSKAE
jgi:hypothetical protein